MMSETNKETRQRQMNISVSAVLFNRIKKQADDRGVTFRSQVLKLIDNGIRATSRVKVSDQKRAEAIYSEADWSRRYQRKHKQNAALRVKVKELEEQMLEQGEQYMKYINHTKQVMRDIAGRTINPPVILDPDASKAKRDGIQEGMSQFKKIVGRLHWKASS